tara:strand:+ start:995 stop:1447 length:453 start_codon:yes stop_codon:yes gene_type:complete
MFSLTKLYNYISSSVVSLLDYLERRRIVRDKVTQEPYLERYYLFLKERTSFPFNIFIHKFLKSDPDDLHDHPWNYFTFILSGGYWEHTTTGKFWRRPFSCIYRKAKSLHRIELDREKPYCWTLFIPCRRKRDWGFVTKDGWVTNKQYNKL